MRGVSADVPAAHNADGTAHAASTSSTMPARQPRALNAIEFSL
ncbi:MULTISPECIES: hypothetical protein [Stenotrophomonas]|nr:MULTISPECIES: hypothetical protein [Stenotrophomonas]